MNRSLRIYVVLAVVFVAASASTYFLQHSGLGQTLAAVPITLSLVGALYQLLRDESEHQKKLALQHEQQVFALGVTSHMADVAFDKHVTFCEAYVTQLHETMKTMFREGESAVAITLANNLLDIRRAHSVWLTPEIEAGLDPIDIALRKVGSTAYLQSKDPGAALRGGRVQEMFDLFSDIVGLQANEGRTADKQIAITTVIEYVRGVLGVPQLIALRQRLLELHQLPRN